MEWEKLKEKVGSELAEKMLDSKAMKEVCLVMKGGVMHAPDADIKKAYKEVTGKDMNGGLKK
jgi:hypothetical protein